MTKTENGEAETKNKIPSWVVFIVVFAVLAGGFIYLKFVRPHPIITLCESIIIDRLKSPSSYKPLKREMVIIERSRPGAWVSIEYEAVNAFNVKLKGRCKCILGRGEDQGAVMFVEKIASLGESPFNSLGIVKVILGKDEVEVPIRARFNTFSPNIFTPPAPGYVTNWVGNGGMDYFVRKTLDKREIERSKDDAAAQFKMAK